MQSIAELRKMEEKGLITALKEAEHDLFKILFNVHNNESKSIHMIGKTKTHIAQIKTIIREKKLAEKAENI